jgi:CRP/FNR family transcriptional regulator, cyclic AMP receptor protein
MDCTRCGGKVPESARFCTDCGYSLTTPCPACGAANSHDAKFCGACGASVIADPATATRSTTARSDASTKAAREGANLLEKCRLFRALDEHTRWQLASRAHRYRFAAGESIFEIGSTEQSMLAVLTGTVRITARSSTGREIVLADLDSGEVFGEIALLDGRGRTASAVALSACELLVFERRDVLAFLEIHPHACLRLLETLCERLRQADERITEVAFSELSVRLAKVLLSKAICPKGGREEVRRPKLALSQRELAMLIGGTRESVNRCLRDWQRRGIVHLGGGWIVIDAPTALEGIATHN